MRYGLPLVGLLWLIACGGNGGPAGVPGAPGGTTGPDTAPPEVQILTPGAGEVVSGILVLLVYAADPSGVAAVWAQVGASRVDLTPIAVGVYRATVDTTQMPNGRTEILVFAEDNLGNRHLAPAQRFAVTISNQEEAGDGVNQPPIVLNVEARVVGSPNWVGAGGIVSGTAPLTVEFRAQVMDPDNEPVAEYRWDFGNGNYSPEPNPVITFPEGTYAVRLTVYDPWGLPSAPHAPITVVSATNAPPLVRLLAGLAPGDYAAEPVRAKTTGSPVTVYFFADAADPDGGTLTYHWAFGDGNTLESALNTAVHSYQPGTYLATVYVTDDEGLDSAPASLMIFVTLAEPPTVDLRASVDQINWSDGPLSATVGRNVYFLVNFSDPDGQVVEVLCDFGDGHSFMGPSPPPHVYEQEGDYQVSCTVRDDDGLTATDTLLVQVRVEGT